jgi:hypothetical protein
MQVWLMKVSRVCMRGETVDQRQRLMKMMAGRGRIGRRVLPVSVGRGADMGNRHDLRQARYCTASPGFAALQRAGARGARFNVRSPRAPPDRSLIRRIGTGWDPDRKIS